jgi:hypothetical protein
LPAEFLVPMFVLTLIANALLVAFAIRGMRRGQFDPDRPSLNTRAPLMRPRPTLDPHLAGEAETVAVEDPLPDGVRRAIAAGRAAASMPHFQPAPAPRPTLGDEPTIAESAPAAEPASAVESPSAVSVAPAPPAPRRRRTAKDAAIDPSDASEVPPAGARRGRRRFSLPNLDDDHEKVSRSIETFLGGIDAISRDEPTPVDDGATPDDGATNAGGATTVAFVAVAGLPDVVGRTGSRSTTPTSRRRFVESDGVTDALAMVERTLRNAARGTDIVTGDGRARFRIVMTSTGELAARAYLRRIRSTVEPALQALEPPLRLVVATATALDEPLGDAIQRAKQRLSAALAAIAAPAPDVPLAKPGDGQDDGSSAPRAAGD